MLYYYYTVHDLKGTILTMPTEKMDVTILTAKTFIEFVPISSGGHLAHVYVGLPRKSHD